MLDKDKDIRILSSQLCKVKIKELTAGMNALDVLDIFFKLGDEIIEQISHASDVSYDDIIKEFIRNIIDDNSGKEFYEKYIRPEFEKFKNSKGEV